MLDNFTVFGVAQDHYNIMKFLPYRPIRCRSFSIYDVRNFSCLSQKLFFKIFKYPRGNVNNFWILDAFRLGISLYLCD